MRPLDRPESLSLKLAFTHWSLDVINPMQIGSMCFTFIGYYYRRELPVIIIEFSQRCLEKHP